MYVCMYVHICIYVYTYIRIYVYMYICKPKVSRQQAVGRLDVAMDEEVAVNHHQRLQQLFTKKKTLKNNFYLVNNLSLFQGHHRRLQQLFTQK